ncbi:lipoprotein [Glycomyces endophyticus]|uniref:Lipoprotein n=1 Tax=Glycomyces endophyticus TaxID=480996 RepID=A0ABP4RS81_9ACTN
MPLPTRARAAAALAGCALLAGCSSGPEAPAADASPTPHGFVEGAEETAEAQWRLVVAEAATGEVRLLDPVTEEAVAIGSVPGAAAATTDGRFVYVSGDAGTTVVDSGVWTVDHGDHVHYYRAEPRSVGEIDGTGYTAVGDPAVTVLNAADGALPLDRASLESGAIEPAATVGAQVVLPYDQRLLAVGDGAVRVLGRDGTEEAEFAETCADPHAPAVTRRGAVIACADGALLVSGEGGLTAEKIPYPAGGGVDGGFHHRAGAAVLAATGDDGGVLVLDVKGRKWTALDVADPVAVVATGEDTPVLVLTGDGALSSFDPATGAPLARTEPIVALGGGAAPAIQVDTARAYVSDPNGGAVHEIDYRDDLRLARTFDLGFRPDLMVETGW